MAFRTLKPRDVPEVYWVLERPVRYVASGARPLSKSPEIDRMHERPDLCIRLGRRLRVKDGRVTNVAVVRDHLSRFTEVVAGMAAKTSREIKVADVVRMSLPVCPHLRKEISLENTLNFADCLPDRVLLL